MLLAAALVLATLGPGSSAQETPGPEPTVEIVDGVLRVTPPAAASPGEAPAAGSTLSIEDGRLVLRPNSDATPPAARADLPPARERAQELVRVAVARGAPLFNAGLPEACAAIYDVALRGLLLLDADVVDADLRRGLESRLANAARSRDAVDAAWELRAGLDEALLTFAVADEVAGAPPTPRPATSGESSPRQRFAERELFAFDGGAPWSSVNDDVMGGLSRGSLRMTERGTAVYSGRLSLENNGGFSTVRSPARDLDLAGWDGLLLRVRGDGRRYSIRGLKSDARNTGHAWSADFETEADAWIEVRVPFSAMIHKVMGFELGDSVDPASIRSLSFMIADKNTLPFALEVDSIRAWREP